MCEAQQAKLDDVSFRGVIKELEKHLRNTFPDAGAGLPPEARWQWIHEFANQAYHAGYTSEQDIWRYTTLGLMLGNEVLQRHPDIAALITQPSELPASLRLEKAVALAFSRFETLGSKRP